MMRMSTHCLKIQRLRQFLRKKCHCNPFTLRRRHEKALPMVRTNSECTFNRKRSRKEASLPSNRCTGIREKQLISYWLPPRLRSKIRHKDIGTRLAGLKGETNKENFCDTVFLANAHLKLLSLYQIRVGNLENALRSQ